MRIVSEEIVWSGKFISVALVRFIDLEGKPQVYEVVRRMHNDVVGIFALTPKREVLVERIFRVPVGAAVIELPVGLVDPGETPKEAARRELREETGYEADALKEIFCGVMNPGLIHCKFTWFFAQNVKKAGEPRCEPTEDIALLRIPLKRFVNFVTKDCRKVGIMVDVKTLGVLPILLRNGLINRF